MNVRPIFLLILIGGLLSPAVLFSQEDPGPAIEARNRSTIPEILIRPLRGEAARYPMDMVIGALNQGDVPAESYRFAREVLRAFAAGNRDAPVLSAVNSTFREALFSSLGAVEPRKFRLGSGQTEPDGAISFLVRFMGREQGIAGELYIRTEIPEIVPPGEPEEGEEEVKEAAAKIPSWQFDDLILEEPLSLDKGQEDPSFDLPPYERFF
jgi:hypothetical protein